MDDFRKNSLEELEKKRKERLSASFQWSSIIDALQADMQSYVFFCENIASSLTSLYGTYVATNINFRNTDEPNHFSDEISADFILNFEDAHPNIKYELKSDEEKVEQLNKNEAIIKREYEETHQAYTTFFDKERGEIFSVINS